MGGDKNKDYIRGGNRGGADQFKWDDVRLMTYKDRECYLGVSEHLGVLDKGGKWKRNDWWIKDQNGMSDDAYELMLERKLIKAQEDAVMRKRLGMPPKPGDDEILAAKNNGQKLQSYEIKELIRRNEGNEEEDVIGNADKIGGVGFSKYGMTAHQGDIDPTLSKLEGVGMEEFRRMKKKLEKEKKSKSKHKKDKKSKKDRKSKKSKKSKKRKHSSSSSDSESESDSSREKRREKKSKRKARDSE